MVAYDVYNGPVVYGQVISRSWGDCCLGRHFEARFINTSSLFRFPAATLPHYLLHTGDTPEPIGNP